MARKMDRIIKKWESLRISVVEVIIVIAMFFLFMGIFLPAFLNAASNNTGERVKYAYIFKPDGSVLVEGTVDNSYINSETGQCQVTINGRTYSCDSDNLVLVDY